MSFLQQNGLARHADLFRRHGFDDMETLLEMSDADVKDIGIPAVDCVKLRRRLKQLRGTPQAPDEANPVVAFLQEIGLQQYAGELLRNGFDDLETLMEMHEADMQDMGMLRGHSLKLSKRLRELRAEGSATAEATAVAAPVALHPAERMQRPAAVPPPPEGYAERVERLGSSPPSAPTRSAVQASWERIQRLGSSAFGERLYRNVFKLAPNAVDLFPPEVRYKYRDWTLDEVADESDLLSSPALKKLFGKIVNAIGLSVVGMHEPTKMVPMLLMLGSRHVGYSVIPEFFPVMGEALNLTLEECLGEEFTPEVRSSWCLTFRFISAIMIEGLKDARAAAAAELRKLDDDVEEESPNSSSTMTPTPSYGASGSTAAAPQEPETSQDDSAADSGEDVSLEG